MFNQQQQFAPQQFPQQSQQFQPQQQFAPQQFPQQSQQFQPQQQFAPQQPQGFAPANPFASGGNPFSGMAQAKVSVSPEYIRAGRYWGRVNICKTGSRHKDGVLYAAVDLTVVQVLDNNGGLGHRMGDDVSYYTQKGLYFLSDVKAFIAAATSADNADAVDENAAVQVFGPGQPLRNMVVEFEAKERTTKEGDVFTKVTFKREVPPIEVLTTLQQTAPQMIQHLFPDGMLEKMCAMEAQNAQPVQPQAPQQAWMPPAQVQPQQFAPAPAPVQPQFPGVMPPQAPQQPWMNQAPAPQQFAPAPQQFQPQQFAPAPAQFQPQFSR